MTTWILRQEFPLQRGPSAAGISEPVTAPGDFSTGRTENPQDYPYDDENSADHEEWMENKGTDDDENYAEDNHVATPVVELLTHPTQTG
ncbi:MAG: hypothetical protein QOH60_3228 [Mycobacterium sp.]|jgi:hypothetical protein|nr:hypothetical protein [Mycobacterium sp.]